MSKGKPKIRSHKPVSSGYYMPETMPLVLCGACLIVALGYSEKARGIYNQIVESYRLPDIQAAFKNLEIELPPRKEMLKKVTEDLGIKQSQEKDESKSLLPDGDSLKRLESSASGYSYVLGKWFDIERDKILSTDFRYWHGLINELIRVGFNNESQQAKGVYKITGENSPMLFAAIMIRSFAEYNNVELVNDEITKAIRIAGTTHDFTRLLEDKATSRKHRVRTKAYKKAGYKLHQDEKIVQIALYWYFSRVVYSGPQEFCNQMLKKDFIMDASNVSNEIRECDYAMGYPRGR